MADLGALEGGRSGTRPTDGKIKAPPSVGRKWLVGWIFRHIGDPRLLALLP
jgi:hypothetical protein